MGTLGSCAGQAFARQAPAPRNRHFPLMLSGSRGLLLLLFVILTTFTSGCSSIYDAWFVNPCAHPVTVETHPTLESDEVIATETVPPLRSVEVKEAFTDAAGFEWAVTVDGGEPLPVDWERFKRERGTVVIPASSCRSD